jgi:integrase
VVVDGRRKSPVYAIRFNANGRRQYVTLGSARDGWTQAKAQDELESTLAAVRLGTWTPPEPEPTPTVESDPTFHDFASDWFEEHENEWREKTRQDYAWALSYHLLPFFKHHRLSQITIAEVDRYRTATLKRGKIGALSINKTITRLAQILEVAVERELIERNPARGRRRRLKVAKSAPVWLDSAEHIGALLDAAGELDRESGGRTPRRAILTTLTFAGLRIGELVELRWRDVNLADGRITVRESKTDAGARLIDVLPALRDELATHKASAKPSSSSERVFPTRTGGPLNPSNIRHRILVPAVKRADERLENPLPERLTPHKLRHTFASVLVALGVDPGAVMDQLGHTDPNFTLQTYRHGMRRDERSREQLAQLVGVDSKRQRKGSSGVSGSEAAPIENGVGAEKTAY